MRRATLAAFTNIRDDAVLAEIVAKIDAGDIEGAITAIGITRAQMAPMEDAVVASFVAGGIATAGQIGRQSVGGTGISIAVRFNSRSPRAEAWIAQNSSTLVTRIIEDQREMLRGVLTEGLQAGRNPRSTALDIVGRVDRSTGRRAGGFIGLTNQQAGYVRNMRAQLESGDPLQMAAYFDRQRRDRRLDGIVRRAIEDGKPVSTSDMQAITGRYNDRLLSLRGETIARTESLNALRAGQLESVQQAMEETGTQAQEATKTWDSTGDGKTRDIHTEMDGQRIAIGEAYTSPTGARLMYPGDSSLGAGGVDTINCRCSSDISVDFIGRALRLEGF